jgi:hypothetical protein
MRRFFALMVAATTFANVFGQNPPTSPNPGFSGGGKPSAARRVEEGRMEIEFKGGKPEALLAEMESFGHKPNVIIHPEARNISIPPFSLRGVTPSQIFNALNMLEPGQGPVWQSVINEDGEIWTLMPPPRMPQAIDPLTGLPIQPDQPAKPLRSKNKQCRVYNLTPVLEEYTVEDLTTAIKGAWELMNVTEEPAIKYHKDTKLLIVFGEQNELYIVDQVINELRSNIRSKQTVAKTADPTKPDQTQQPKKQ